MNKPTRRAAAIPAITLAAIALTLSACAQNEAPPQAAEPGIPFKPTASIQEIMLSVVDPSADALWESVAVITTEKGTEERHPRTDEDWAAVRRHAITLIEAANLLMIPGRQVAHPGKALQDEGVHGVLTRAEVQALIDKDHAGFASHAIALHDTAVAALKAIDAKSVEGLSEVGGPIDEACESCHMKYWYPNSAPPPSTVPEPPPAADDTVKP